MNAAWKQDMATNLPDFPAEITRSQVVNTAAAAEFCNYSIPHWRRLYRAGKAPAPVRLSARKYGWRIGDLIDWIQTSRSLPE
jgi:predicted DNA-binding transcriptional regulator AlpA